MTRNCPVCASALCLGLSPAQTLISCPTRPWWGHIGTLLCCPWRAAAGAGRGAPPSEQRSDGTGNIGEVATTPPSPSGTYSATPSYDLRLRYPGYAQPELWIHMLLGISLLLPFRPPG